MTDSVCKCFTGRISRLVNVLNGFYDDIVIKIGDNEQIGNIIVVIKERLLGTMKETDNGFVEKWRNCVNKEMLERGFTEEVINEWMSFID